MEPLLKTALFSAFPYFLPPKVCGTARAPWETDIIISNTLTPENPPVRLFLFNLSQLFYFVINIFCHVLSPECRFSPCVMFPNDTLESQGLTNQLLGLHGAWTLLIYHRGDFACTSTPHLCAKKHVCTPWLHEGRGPPPGIGPRPGQNK